jgi:hypothetical protein
MYILWSLLIFLFSFNLSAQEFSTQIDDIDYGDKSGEEVLVFLANGMVAKIMPDDGTTLSMLKEALENESNLRIELNEEREIIFLEVLPNIKIYETRLYRQEKSLQSIRPTVISSMDWAHKYFNESRVNHKKSQCFNRAHIWSYEWKMKHNINSQKLFIFFSRKYIRENNFQWWFHVAPYMHVVVGDKIKERVMDMKYTHGPSTIRQWITSFKKHGPPVCLTVTAFTDYANYPESGDCYLMRADMYTYWPLDLEQEELFGIKKRFWIEEEIKVAYLEAFDVRI